METSTSPEGPVKRFLRRTREAITNPKLNLLHPRHRQYVPQAMPNEVAATMSRPQTPIELKTTLPISQETNRTAGQVFIENLRNPTRYNQSPYNARHLINNVGFELDPETGYFIAGSLQRVAENRYQLPVAFYIDGRHAMLIVKAFPRDASGTRKLKIYDPFHQGTREVSLNASDSALHIIANTLAGQQVATGRYDIDFLNNPIDGRISVYREELMNAKFADFQKDAQNCLPYCLFVNAMLHGLNPNSTPFKSEGRRLFEQDFGVKVLTREEILPRPKPQVRIVE